MSQVHPQRDWVKLSLGWSRILSPLALAIGLAEIAVWVTRPAWIDPDSVLYFMKANAALAVTLTAVAAWLAVGVPTPRRRRAVFALAAGVLAISLLTLVEYLPGAPTGFDLLLGVDPSGQGGRMAAQTAVNLLLFAVALLTYSAESGPRSWLCDGCLVAAGLIVEVMVMGYFDNADLLYDLSGRGTPARQSGIAQILLGGALVFGRTGRGAFAIFAGTGLGSSAMRVLMPVIVLMPIVVGRIRRFGDELGWLSPSYGHALFVVTQTLFMGIAVCWFALYVNRLDGRYRVERQRREEIERYVAVCAWTRRVRWEGKWISIEDFLQRRFGLEVTHGISDEALAEQLASLAPRDALADEHGSE